MPYLKLIIPEQTEEQYHKIAVRLTEEINDLFFHPKGRLTREELRERTTVHFVPYNDE